jgi:lauroyl/myristoyl acyltransferase
VVRFSSDRLRSLSKRKGRRFHIRIIDADRTPNVFFAICRDLRQNRVVVTQCDEIDAWRPAKSGTVSFLGRRTAPDRALNLLVRRARCPVLFGVMHRNPGFGYRFVARRHSPPGESPAAGIGTAGLKFIEALVYRYPHQWYQWHKFLSIEEVKTAEPEGVWRAPSPSFAPSMGGIT